MDKGRKVYQLFKKMGLGIICGVLLLGIVTGCGDKKKEDKEGDSFKISLYSNSSTGYSWSYTVSNEGIIDISESYDDSNCPPENEGCGGQQVYKVKALKPGKTTISLKYSFVEPDERDYETAIYEITVNDDLSITETHSGTYFDE